MEYTENGDSRPLPQFPVFGTGEVVLGGKEKTSIERSHFPVYGQAIGVKKSKLLQPALSDSELLSLERLPSGRFHPKSHLLRIGRFLRQIVPSPQI